DLAVHLADHVSALEIEGDGVDDAYVHEGRFVSRPGDPDAVEPDGRITVNAPADADLVIAAVSVATRTIWPGLDGSLWTTDGAAIGERSAFSSIGPRRDGYEKPDIAAPGEFVVAPLSADAAISFDDTRIAPDGSYAVLRGTSMATAHTTGMVALLLEQNPQISSVEIVERVRAAGTAGSWSPELGYGVLNPHALLDVPWPPVGVRADVVTARPVVSWDAFLEPSLSYRVYVDGVGTDVPGETSLALPDFGDGELTVTVTSVNAAGRESAASTAIVITPAGARLGPTTSVTVQNLSGGVTLEWEPVDGAALYRIEWGLGENALVNVFESGLPGATIGGLANGVVYFFRVIAVGFDGGLGVGSEVAVTAPRPTPTPVRTGLTMRAGFPIEAGHDYIAAPTVADINGDGNLEVFVANVDGSVYGFRHDGRPARGWPQSTGEPIVGSVAIADIDLDGVPEIAVAGGRSVYVWHADGSPMRGFPVETANVIRAHPVLTNVDQDPTLEVLAAVSAGTAAVYAWDAEGELVEGYPLVPADLPVGAQPIPTGFIYTPPVVADADFDGRAEVYVSTRFGGVFSWDQNGEARDGFPVIPEGVAVQNGGVPEHAAPILAMLGGDTLTLLSGGRTAGVIAHDLDGEVRPGFPVPVRRYIGAPLSVGDLDGDGFPEIIAADESGLLYSWRYDGSLVDGFPTDLVNSGKPAPITPD
ncbi:MAG: FG-GAP-like repeat-containing protein, partial [Candidatus Poribacteria bacterium]